MTGPTARIEVEVKARLDNPEKIQTAVEAMAVYRDERNYVDTYFTFAGTAGYQKERFRLRRDGRRSIVTAKRKLEEAGAEASLELEFEVSDGEAFTAFAVQFGFRVMMEKEKRVRGYSLGPQAAAEFPVTMELVEVTGIGPFIEIEIMVDHAGEVAAAASLIRRLIHDLGLSESQIERRPYTRMLYEKIETAQKPQP